MNGNIIRKLRGNLTQLELAKRVGLTQAAIAKYEKARVPKKEILEKIAAATGYRIIITIEKIEEEKGNNGPE